LGRPIWLTDEAVQFRDEPTETWFREQFSATPDQIAGYIKQLKPLAAGNTYVAEVLPGLLLRAGQYEELIRLALSDEALPEGNPLDQRNIRVARLRFAFQAALKSNNYFDAAQLAYRAGEEVAGDKRQLELLKQNTDLIKPLLSLQHVQDLAYRRDLSSYWPGSDSLYTAVLLSSLASTKGDARSALRMAGVWLDQHLKSKDEEPQDYLQDNLVIDIAEMALVHFRLSGAQHCVKFLEQWCSSWVFDLGHICAQKLVDAGLFDAINEIARFGSHNKYLVIAIADELLQVGRYLPSDVLETCLDSFLQEWLPISSTVDYREEGTLAHAYISFAESCAANKIDKLKILAFLDHYVPQRGTRLVSSQHHFSGRNLFLRGIALKSVLAGEPLPKPESLMPEDWERISGRKDDVEEFRQVVGRLLPWYLLRARAFTQEITDFETTLQEARESSASVKMTRWFEYDQVPFEVSRMTFEAMLFTGQELTPVLESLLRLDADNKLYFRLSDRLSALRAVYRLESFANLRSLLEDSCYQEISTAHYDDPTTRADELIRLARVVLIADSEEGTEYFNEAIEAVSKFGDEVLQRWDTVMAMGERAAEGGPADPKLVYRFLRNAELVGEHVEEKHFDREKTLKIGLMLDPATAYAALSRWRDRDIGCFDSLNYAIGSESVQAQLFSPSVCWALSTFEGLYQDGHFAKQCIEFEQNPSVRQSILDQAIDDFMKSRVPMGQWVHLEKAASQFHLHNPKLQAAMDSFARQPSQSEGLPNKAAHSTVPSRNMPTEPAKEWDSLFHGLNVSEPQDFEQAIGRARASFHRFIDEEFWPEILKRIPETIAASFLQRLLTTEGLIRQDFQDLLKVLPSCWRQRRSVQNIWPQLLTGISRRFAAELVIPYRFDWFVDAAGIDASQHHFLHTGILQGLPESGQEFDASIYFCCVSRLIPLITPQEATQLLDFALSRFEVHMPSELGDGPWDEWLQPSTDPTTAFTGFLWAALGSPRSSIRWQAAHCVRRLAAFNSQAEISSLLAWLEQADIGAFGARQYPFYRLHARQYLLIALARIVQDQPELLRAHHSLFLQLALHSEPHILIQLFSANIALALEQAYPGTYDSDTVTQLKEVDKSPYPTRAADGPRTRYNSPWHEQGGREDSPKLHFGTDLPPYWFDPLGDVFGVPVNQIQELVSDVILKDWQLPIEEKYIRDPRVALGRSRGFRNETRHSHGSYPRTDDYSFYLGYHGMMAVAAKLLKAMPVLLQKEGWRNKEWEEWLLRHLLTRADGGWLADRRDAMPLERRDWVYETASNEWNRQSTNEDLLDGLLFEYQGEVWLYTRGFWVDIEHNREERFHITSALVAEKTADALLHALATCQNHHDYRLPDYDDEMEIADDPFILSGWIQDGEISHRLDKYDPHAANINYPPYAVARTIVEQFALTTDGEQREWFTPDDSNASLRSEVWSEKASQEPEQSTRHGTRIGASLRFLKRLCEESSQALIIEVELERDISESYQRRNYDREAHKNHKVYLLCRDGVLRDTESRYCLREKVGDGA
jgi:hypothetical protein